MSDRREKDVRQRYNRFFDSLPAEQQRKQLIGLMQWLLDGPQKSEAPEMEDANDQAAIDAIAANLLDDVEI